MAKQRFDYFGKFEESAYISHESAKFILDVLTGFSEKKLPDQMEKIHKLENDADQIKHDIQASLLKDFLPPIEIDDIMQLGEHLDDVMDYMEDIMTTLYSYNITEIKPQAVEFCRLIVKCSEVLVNATKELKSFKKSTLLKPMAIELNQYENEGDSLYISALRDLYTNETDAVTILKWTKLYDYFERCCDAMEDVADTIENVILKNS